MVAGVIHLVELAQREQFAQVAQSVDDADIARRYGLLHGRRDKEVADKDSDVVVPGSVDCRLSAAGVGTVHDIVVDERGVVQQLDGRGGGDDTVGDRPEQACGENDDNGADKLALGAQVVGDYAVHQRVVGSQRSLD